MNVVFRADASLSIGSGHVMRCLTLAEALRERGAVAMFVCREHEGHMCDLVSERGFAVARLPAPVSGFKARGLPKHATWLRVDWEEDAGQTKAAIEKLRVRPEWLVVDHYALDARWEHALRSLTSHIMAIDDLADKVHDCDLLLDQNLVPEMNTRYADKVPASCGLLLGPEYALLQPIYADLHDHVAPRKGPIRRILIFFGAADRHNLTGRALDAFLRFGRSDIDVDVVVTTCAPDVEAIELIAAQHGNVHLHRDLPTLAPLMAEADLAIGASGATSWERLCMSLPAIVVTVADNQRSAAAELQRRGLIRWLGSASDVSDADIAEALKSFLYDGLQPGAFSYDKSLVDGRGSGRVCEVILHHKVTFVT